MSKDRNVLTTPFGDVALPNEHCKLCVAAEHPFHMCTFCTFKNELMKAGLAYVNNIQKQILNKT